jgi:Tfp pilus assembly protein FimT
MMADMYPSFISQPLCGLSRWQAPHVFTKQSRAYCTHRTQTGYSLAELCVVICLVAVAAAMAAPSVSHWLWRSRVENAARAWAVDLQSARLQALRTGQALQLQRLTGCARFLPTGDWRCGWEVVGPDSKQPAQLHHVMNGELSVVLFPAKDFLPINTQGEPVAGGLRLQVMPHTPKSPLAVSVCMNIAGRLRFVKSATCS